MRLVGIEVEEFRGWVRPERVDLDAAVVIIQGPNGTGKTSLFDAILWVITGEITRLGDEHKHDVVSRYGESGNARVRLELRSTSGDAISITRSTNGAHGRLRVDAGPNSYTDEEASLQLMRRMWPNGLGGPGGGTMSAAISRSVYLQQDDVRRFVEADTSQQRFSAVAELVGAGRLTEIQRKLEGERLVWSRQTNESKVDASRIEARASQIAAQVSSLSTDVAPYTAWAEWRDAVRALLGDELVVPEEMSAPRASEAVDLTVRRLEEVMGSRLRRADRAAQLRRELSSAVSTNVVPLEQLEQAEQEVVRTNDAVSRIQGQVTEAERAAAAERDRLVQQQNTRLELQSLATLALRHLGPKCPVCEQEYDHNTTLHRLERMAQSGPSPLPAITSGALQELSARLVVAERDRSEARARLQDLQRSEVDRTDSIARVSKEIAELGAEGPAEVAGNALMEIDHVERAEAERLRGLIREGESIALLIAQSAERTRRMDLQNVLESTRSELLAANEAITRRDTTGELANRMIDALRASSDELVSRRVTALAPILARIYSRIDPHPSFRDVELVSEMRRGHGWLETRISDEAFGVQDDAPQVLLSSSQLNALALSVFLSLNLGIADPPLDSVLLDDPLQSLDEVNLLGVVDLLRRYKARRQLVISTHDRRFAGLLQRKLRATEPDQPIALVNLSDWGRLGPRVQEVVSGTDGSPWKIAATG